MGRRCAVVRGRWWAGVTHGSPVCYTTRDARNVQAATCSKQCFRACRNAAIWHSAPAFKCTGRMLFWGNPNARKQQIRRLHGLPWAFTNAVYQHPATTFKCGHAGIPNGLHHLIRTRTSGHLECSTPAFTPAFAAFSISAFAAFSIHSSIQKSGSQMSV